MSIVDDVLDRIRRMRDELDGMEKSLRRFDDGAVHKGPKRVQMRPSEVEEAVRLYQSGLTMRQVERKMGYGDVVLKRHMAAAGVRLRPRGGSQMNRQQRAEQSKGLMCNSP